MSPESLTFVCRAKALLAKRSKKGYGDMNGKWQGKALASRFLIKKFKLKISWENNPQLNKIDLSEDI